MLIWITSRKALGVNKNVAYSESFFIKLATNEADKVDGLDRGCVPRREEWKTFRSKHLTFHAYNRREGEDTHISNQRSVFILTADTNQTNQIVCRTLTVQPVWHFESESLKWKKSVKWSGSSGSSLSVEWRQKNSLIPVCRSQSAL